MKTWQDFGFEVEITGDGSPSLHLLESADPSRDRGESMHHSGGAASETLLIYGQPVREALVRRQRGDFLVVGLGLGYIEATIAREALLLGVSPDKISILSLESVPELRDFYIFWLHNSADISESVREVYDKAVGSLLRGSDISLDTLKAFLRSVREFKVQGALQKSDQVEGRFDGILYDAFSSKTSPHLWEERFLTDFIRHASKPEVFFSTYACRASLKRALKANEFEVHVREGFMGKRNSTLGLRGESK